ncbi:MAG: hypothetical protein ACRD3C_16700 [Vicinamibacterales bacterium]
MRTRFVTVALCLSALAVSAVRADAQGHVAELGVMFWKPSPTLTLSTDAVSGLSIDEVDFVEEFGIEDKWFREFRAALGRSHKFRFSYVKFSYEADATIQRTFTFQGRRFTIGAPATTDIEWDLWKIGYEWDVVSSSRGFFGVITGVEINQMVASVDSPVLRSAASTDVTVPAATLGIIGRGYISPTIAITGEFSGLKIPRTDFDVTFVDFDINGTFGSRNVGAQVGYRSVTADYEVDADTGHLEMKGPYLGIFVRF